MSSEYTIYDEEYNMVGKPTNINTAADVIEVKTVSGDTLQIPIKPEYLIKYFIKKWTKNS